MSHSLNSCANAEFGIAVCSLCLVLLQFPTSFASKTNMSKGPQMTDRRRGFEFVSSLTL